MNLNSAPHAGFRRDYANCRKRACSRFRGRHRPQAGFLRGVGLALVATPQFIGETPKSVGLALVARPRFSRRTAARRQAAALHPTHLRGLARSVQSKPPSRMIGPPPRGVGLALVATPLFSRRTEARRQAAALHSTHLRGFARSMQSKPSSRIVGPPARGVGLALVATPRFSLR
jgi:hypothetical protein